MATRTNLSLNLSGFQGTIVPHATIADDGRFTLDTSNGSENCTFNIPENVIVQNSGKTFRIGKLTGKGSLGGFCAFRNGVSEQTNTWQVGNDKNFKFEGSFTSKDTFNKVANLVERTYRSLTSDYEVNNTRISVDYDISLVRKESPDTVDMNIHNQLKQAFTQGSSFTSGNWRYYKD